MSGPSELGERALALVGVRGVAGLIEQRAERRGVEHDGDDGAAAGAIEGVRIADDALALEVIDDAEPVGICGSGLVDAVAELVHCGLIDRSGRFLAEGLKLVIDALDLKEATLVGHSTGGGEVAHYIGRHGTSRVAKVVLIGAVPPIMLKTEANPGGLPMSVFDGIRDGVAANRSQFYKDLAVPFYGFNRPNAKVSQGSIDEFWREGMLGSILGQYECIKQFSEVDYTADLKKIDVPTLILHGDDDQIVPIDASARLSAKLVKNATLKVYAGAPHGMCTTDAAKVNADLLAFLQS